MQRFVGAFALSLLVGCSIASGPGMVRDGTPDEVNIAMARARGKAQLFDWVEWSVEAFAKAKRERRFILIHGAAEWCHWCHVMEATTYRDAKVGTVLRERFVAIRVDIDSRPDIEERYGEWGWPATIVLGPDGQELGKYRGHIPAAEMLLMLQKVQRATAMNDDQSGPHAGPVDVAALPWIGANFARRMDSYYDARQGGWGFLQKAPIGDNVVFELRRFQHGDQAAVRRAAFTLSKHASLIDPVWGGIYQYSDGRTWSRPHYEKLMTYQAANLWAFAKGYQLTKNAKVLRWARAIERYMNTFLSNRQGAFLVTQDADVGAHDPNARFVDGQVYYRLDDAARRKLGVPRVDDHVYAEDNGLAITALTVLYEATRDVKVLARCRKAADLLLRTHVDASASAATLGRVKHDAASKRNVYYAADAAAFGFGLARLAEVMGEPGARYRTAALRIATAMLRDLHDPSAGGFWANTPDPAAFGVFKKRRKPYFANVTAARLFAALHRLTADASWRGHARRTLAAITQPAVLRERGRMIGTYLLALDEAGALRW